MRNTQGILKEMLRVGHEAVVSFPNFAYWRHRQSILNGRMPVSKNLPYQWYDTPNVRFFTIADFDALCEQEGIVIRERLAFDEDKVIVDEPNFLASVALYRLARADGAAG
jgi:methionine biosynthesis protein MetW